MLAYIRVRTDILTPSACKYTCQSEVRNAGAMKGASKATSKERKSATKLTGSTFALSVSALQPATY